MPEGVDAINKSAKAKAPLSLTFGDAGSNSHPILVTSARASSSAMDLVRRAKSWLMVRGFAVLDYLGMPCPELKKLEASFKKYTERRNVAIPPETTTQPSPVSEGTAPVGRLLPASAT